MKIKALLISLTLLYNISGYSQSGTLEKETVCISKTEARLAQMINDYRKSRKLPPIPLSASLSKVAKLHAIDLANNYKPGENCNLHSWSDDPRWSSCCYTPDHKKSDCMWDKPRELTSYSGDGYEIAYYSTFNYATPQAFLDDALKGWKSSKGHNEILINAGKWKTAEWKAMGVAVFGEYSVIWFGELTDKAGKPKVCEY